MKTVFARLTVLLALAAAPTAFVIAQNTRTEAAVPAGVQGTDLTQGVYVASVYAEDRSLRRYAGMKLLNNDHAELGTIKDFVVHVPSGRVRYAVVSSGGVLGGIGNSLRLVPFEALHHSGDFRPEISVDISQSHWLQVPPISDENYVIDRFDITPAQHQQWLQDYGTTAPVIDTAPASEPNAAFNGLLRASTLRGKTVVADGVRVGAVKDIILDLERGVAAALLATHGEFTGTKAKYLVPLNRLGLTAPAGNSLTTNLTRADFDRAPPSDFGRLVKVEEPTEHAVTPRREPMREASPTPTGHMDTYPATVPTMATLYASADAVRKALRDDPAISGERVRVAIEDGHVVLHGSVRSETLRSQIETTARRAATASTVESQLTVDPR